MNRFLLSGIFAGFGLCIVLLAGSCSGDGEAPGEESGGVQLGLLMETYDVDRWARDQAFFEEKAESLGARVMSAVADGDQDRQNKQAESLLTRGADALVVIPKNLSTAGRIIKVAHEKNVPVVAYDRLIRDCDLDIYVTFDNEKVGYLQAKGILENVPDGNYILLGGAASDNNAALFRAGQMRAITEHNAETENAVTILADPFLDNWDRDEARRRIAGLITKFKAEGTEVHAIVASNDSTAGGAIAALKAEGLAGRVAVSGQDADLAGCQRVVEGTQTLTVYKPVRKLATAAAEVAVRLSEGAEPAEVIASLGMERHQLDNGYKEVDSIFLEPVYVTRENMADTVIADGWHPLEKVYANVPEGDRPAGN
jgi:D-xylose transport system substrate-binding protein